MTEGEFLKDVERQAIDMFQKRLSEESIAITGGDETGAIFYTGSPFDEESILELDTGMEGRSAGLALYRAAVELFGVHSPSTHHISHGTVRAYQHIQSAGPMLTVCMPIRVVAKGAEA